MARDASYEFDLDGPLGRNTVLRPSGESRFVDIKKPRHAGERDLVRLKDILKRGCRIHAYIVAQVATLVNPFFRQAALTLAVNFPRTVAQ